VAKLSGNKPNYFYTLVSVTLVLFLLGLFGLLAVQGKQYIKTLKENIEIIVELKPDTPAAAVDSLNAFLAAAGFYKAGSAAFISKEEGLAMMRAEFGPEFLQLDMANPLYDVVTFNVLADWMEGGKVQLIRQELKQFFFINDVYFQESVADTIALNLRNLSLAVLAAGILLIFVATALILNTIRLALYANRFLIKNMELVGASWGFISRPYLLRSLWHGLLSALLAILALAALLYTAVRFSGQTVQEWLDLRGTLLVFAALVLMGILLNIAGTYYIVRKYLSMRLDDLY
jgi:cell division transport system permease protein